MRRRRFNLEDLKAHIDLTEMYGSGKVLCPWHDDHTPSLQVYPDHVFCFSCGLWQDAIEYVRKVEELSFMEAVDFLEEHRHEEMVTKPTVILTPIDWAQINQDTQALLDLPARHYAWQWLHDRGLDENIVRGLHLGWTGREYAIPHVVNGQVRNIKYRIHPKYQQQGVPKYQSLPGRTFTHLYPWDYFRVTFSDSRTLFLVEGELDAALMLQAGLPTLSVPSGAGTDIKPWVPVFRGFKTVYIVYDMDNAGIVAARKFAEDKGRIGRTVCEMVWPTVMQRITWAIEWGKDITDARHWLIPRLRSTYEKDI